MREHVKGVLPKCTVLKVDLLKNHQIYCLQACMCAIFIPVILQVQAVMGLKMGIRVSHFNVSLTGSKSQDNVQKPLFFFFFFFFNVSRSGIEPMTVR